MPQVSFELLVAGVQAGDRLVSFPTDTVPALATLPEQAALIFAAKQRALDKPLILMAAQLADLWPYVGGTPTERSRWEQVAAHYWPGALTLVLPASDRVPTALNPLDPRTIGVRVPNHAIARQILAATGPLATTSANRSGEPALQTMAAIEAQFPTVLTLKPEAFSVPTPAIAPEVEVSSSGVPSTVAKWTGTGWQILRQGAITLEEEP